MRRHLRSTTTTKLGIMICLLALLLGTPRAFGGPQDPGASPSPDALQELLQRIDKLSASVDGLRAEVERSHKETQELRQQLATTREQLMLLTRSNQVTASADPPRQVASSENGENQPPKNESLQAKLDQLEEDQQLLQSKVDDQYQTKVESASKYRVKLSGIALLNLFGTSGSVDNLDSPNFARDRGPLDTSGSFGASVRQSMLGLALSGPDIAGARTSADVQLDFFGGFSGTIDGSTMGLVRLRTARMRLDWGRTSLVAGQDVPFISPNSPTSLATLADPAFSYAGNLWTWTPQVRVEHSFAVTDEADLTLTGGILDPLSGEIPYAQYYRQPQAGERSRQPAYATRLGWSSSAWKQSFTLGLGSYYSRQNWGFGRNVDAWGVTADWQVPFGHKVGLSGEFYRGRALGGLGAGEGRSVVYNGPLTSPGTSVLGLNAVGGWTQLKFSPTEKLEFNSAFGEDEPYAKDLNTFATTTSYVAPQISRNQTVFLNFIYRVRSNILFSGEYRKIWTSDKNEEKSKADIINLSMGVLF